ncbi:restriction endonuclease subunit S [Acinetobacter sp. SWAC5]|uniref:restriction endonuclease subunit S n=1 Tax=Acinetobacter sp. SWAC5 TaxID=2293835 RepID=UPI000E349972|nr:restriction endonuclease subunit S [Acinetobacter sp. SWAC5]RFS35317.1 restriction endonuclease subunit S [Acinetobacter sp. SWAC5]
MVKYQKYAEYKDSGVEWLENVPREWDIIKIKHLSTVKRGASPRPIDDPKYFDDNGEYAWVRIADVSASDMYLLNTTQTMSDLGSSLSVKLEPNQLFLSIAGTVGKPCINKIKACIHDGFVYFPELKIPNKYLFYVFAGEQAYKGLGKMGTQLNLNTDTVGDIKVALPKSQSDIYKIIEFLDHETTKIDHLIEKQQQLIELLKEKRQAVISHAVTKGLDPNVPMKDSGVEWLGKVPEHWVVKSYRLASRIYRGKFGHRPRNDPAFYDGDYPFIQTGDVARAGKYITSYSQTLNEKGKEVSQLFPKGTLMMAIAANIGDIAILGFEAYAPDSVVGFKPNNDIDLEFLRYSFIAALPALEQTSTQSTQANLNVERIGAVKGTFPSLQEQREIVGYLDNLLEQYRNLVKIAENAISLMQERRTALISAAVTGKIDVRNWQAPTVAEADTEFSA